MSETCVRSVGGPWHFRECGKPAKGRGGYLGKDDVPLCGVHLAAFNRRVSNRERWTRESERRESAAKHAAALSAARDEVVRAAVALAPDIAREHDDGDGHRTVSLDSAEAAAFCAAVAALVRLLEKP